jgi:hypothetical protein
MSGFNRIVVTGDLMRPFPQGTGWVSASAKNIRWLREVLRPALQPLGLPVQMLAWDDSLRAQEGRYFDAQVVDSHASGEHPTRSLQAWAAWTEKVPAQTSFIEALAPALQDALVIGYEMPPSQIDALCTLGLPFIDVVLHPVRFMPDLIFALRTNIPAWHEVFTQHRVSETAIAQQAALIAAKAAWMTPPEPLPPGSALILGQVAIDRAVVSGGRFVSLAEHHHTLHALCVEHPQVLFKPHPYGVGQDRSAKAVAAFPAIRVTQANFYHLVAQPQIDTVVALNSSGLHEARYFGKQAMGLIAPLHDFDAVRPPVHAAPGDPVALDPVWLEHAFWDGLFRGSSQPIQRPQTPNLLRRSMNADWGYGFIERICA